ncbi:MAG TPA: hypothetical protein VJ784_11945 [Pyrinomonadaceae bacterium]|jgi:hypothetical protein|nr:hypothetical protein [Pyrinomonadaceae bacterium]
MDFDQLKHSELTQSYRSGVRWFFWIAGLTLVTSLIALFGGGIRFLLSLGLTQFIDAIAAVLAKDLGGAVQVVALILDIVAAGVFALFGYLAGKRFLWAYILGMVVFLLDGLLSLAFQDVVGVLAHVVVLFFLVRGYLAGREMVSLEKTMAAEAAAAAQPEPAI